MPDSLKRYVDVEDLDVGQTIEFNRTGKRPETDEYRDARVAALDKAGLDHDEKPSSSTTEEEEMSVEDHLARIQQERRGH